MSDAIFVHYVVCEGCGTQYRLVNVTNPGTVAGRRCCNFVWYPFKTQVTRLDIEKGDAT